MKVVCTLENFSGNVNGIQFSHDGKRWVSDDLPDEVGKNLTSINGYSVLRNGKAATTGKGDAGEGAGEDPATGDKPAENAGDTASDGKKTDGSKAK